MRCSCGCLVELVLDGRRGGSATRLTAPPNDQASATDEDQADEEARGCGSCVLSLFGSAAAAAPPSGRRRPAFSSLPSTASVIELGSGSGRSIDGDDRQDDQEVREIIGRRDLAEHHVGLFGRRAAADSPAPARRRPATQKNVPEQRAVVARAHRRLVEPGQEEQQQDRRRTSPARPTAWPG